jgi:NADH dehydrogenase [ubiquinone] 1 alpha subcomplex assembly factor 7
MSPLGAYIRDLIAIEGPIGIDRFMAIALGDPEHGYYMTRDPFGPAGDFVTAPEVSQVFGELLGLWCAELWLRLGRPAVVRLVELGPGRGTLMRDMLRAMAVVPGLADAVRVHLVETSPVLRAAQARMLEGCGSEPTWHGDVADVPPGPMLLVANEFFDALAIRQFVRQPDGWHERLVGLAGDGRLALGLSPVASQEIPVAAPDGAVLELSPAGVDLMRRIAGRIARHGGGALVVDYGHAGGFGDTLQAVRRHAFADPLDAPGEADLTAHVDFAALARAAQGAGAVPWGPVPQGALLQALGIAPRAAALARSDPAGTATAVARLTGEGPDGMGRLFKALAVMPPQMAAAGFDRPWSRGEASGASGTVEKGTP